MGIAVASKRGVTLARLSCSLLAVGVIAPGTAQADAPSPPASVRAVPGQLPGEIVVSWEPAAITADDAVEEYLVTADGAVCAGASALVVGVSRCEGWSHMVFLNPDATRFTLKGLKPGIRYWISVSVLTRNGSAASEAVCMRPAPWDASLACVLDLPDDGGPAH